MSLEQKISDELTTAQKSKDKTTIKVLRMLQASLKNKKIESRSDLADKDVIAAIKAQVKQQKDSIESYKKGERNDLVAQEETEMKILTKYLPEEMSDEKLRELVSETLKNENISEKKDMGRAMGAAMKAVKGQASGDRVKKIVLAELT